MLLLFHLFGKFLVNQFYFCFRAVTNLRYLKKKNFMKLVTNSF